MTTGSTDRFIDLADQFSATNYHPLPIVIERAEGVWVWDPEGRRYLDMLAAYSAVNQGHCHPRILEVLRSQAERVTLTSRAFHNDQFGPLCQELCEVAGFEKVLLMNTGAEAVETAVKMARKWAYEVKGVERDQAEIIVAEGNFHGRTTTVISFSTDEQYREGFGPLTPGFPVVPFGDADALEAAITPRTAAFLVEPIQGEAGIIIPPDGYLKRVRELCTQHRVLLIADEIQSGLGRTGKLFAHEHAGIRPDALIVGKALSGGFYPVSAVLADSEAMGVFRPGDHGSTFGGNPLGCAVAREALAVLREENLVENSREMGAYLMERLAEVPSEVVEEIRGVGLWIAIEVKETAGSARPYCEALKDRGILAKETHEQVVRIAPPLCITPEEIDWAVPLIVEVLSGKRG
ncbi:MAG: ornithine--oxo-acid transaminase [Gemmatimonadota bacterium]|jgi:ornithine--oxo-acid transaminase|nr:ornithine--oxo-acid transaminase [Gemmatimonadota bacterium]